MIECMHKLTNEFWSAFCPPRRIRNAALGYAYAVGAGGPGAISIQLWGNNVALEPLRLALCVVWVLWKTSP